MKRRTTYSLALMALLAIGLLLSGCSGGEDTEATADKADPAVDSAPTETVAAHDCEGGCGMKAVPEANMTQVDGKWLCGGCAKKAEAAEGHEEG